MQPRPSVQAVYEEDLVHRRPGDDTTLVRMEQPFPITRQWVQQEAAAPGGGGPGGDHSFTRVVIGELKADVLQQVADADKGAQVCRCEPALGCKVAAVCLPLQLSTWPQSVLCLQALPGRRRSVCISNRTAGPSRSLGGCLRTTMGCCRDLAHLYHYYLHGEQGNRSAGAAAGSQGRQQAGPAITLQSIADGRLQWSQNLAEVEDDLESSYLKVRLHCQIPFHSMPRHNAQLPADNLPMPIPSPPAAAAGSGRSHRQICLLHHVQAQQGELSFCLQVPGRGLVSGVLWYFPFQDERETVPQATTSMLRRPQAGISLTQAPPAAPGLTQLPSQHSTQARPSQHAPRATQQRLEDEAMVEGLLPQVLCAIVSAAAPNTTCGLSEESRM